MALHQAQSLIAKDLHRFRVLNCGRRFGKTYLAVEEMVGVALAQKDRRVAYYAPTRDDARDITWSMLIKKCEGILTYKNESRLEIKIMTIDGGESSITLYGWESVQVRGKGRGLANDFLVLDEVSSYKNFWQGWDEVLSPTLIDRLGSALFISTPKGFNHFYDLYNLQDKNADYKSFHFTTYDNPHIPPSEIEREKQTKTEDVFAQEYMADFRKQQGLVYKEFNRDKHLFNDLTERPSVILTMQGADWGFVHPAALITIEKTANDHYWVTDEWVHTGKTDDELIAIAGVTKANKFYPDPESAQSVEKARRAGLAVYEVVKGKGSIDSGVDTVRELFKQGRLHIHVKCKNLITALETWAYDENGNYEEEGKDENDALRYPLMMEAPYTVSEDAGADFNLYSQSQYD